MYVKQIILITDGCSNVGLSPVIAAAQALLEDIVVNVVGVIDNNEIGEMGAMEISEIAKAGGGISRIVSTLALAKTVQMMTRKTVMNTIQQAVNKELRHIVGTTSLEALHPTQRAQVVQAIEDWSESADLHIALLIDSSASMKSKLPAVEEAIRDLMLSLQARAGVSEVAVFHYPGKGSGDEIQMDLNWTRELAKIQKLFYKLNMKGTTPTGPALLHVIHFMTSGKMDRDSAEDVNFSNPAVNSQHSKEGVRSDYVV
jgi:Ca-activated chloride channel family protein